eukprot:1161105-Pelagomonas_calceolata.AAC.20
MVGILKDDKASSSARLPQSSMSHSWVRLHRYIRLQRQQRGNTEACNQTWPKRCSTYRTWKEEGREGKGRVT